MSFFDKIFGGKNETLIKNLSGKRSSLKKIWQKPLKALLTIK